MHIMILEDDECNRNMLQELLEGEGHWVLAFESVLQAFEHLRKGKTDLILMDIGLPGLNGIAFAQKIKKYPALRDIPIIIISGQPRGLHEGHALRSGCDAYFEKPVNTKELFELIATYGASGSDPKKEARPVRK